MGGSKVQFVVGNTYRRLPYERQELDRTGQHRKSHDWTLFVDVLLGDPDVVERVTFQLPTFQPGKFHCYAPVYITRPNGSKAWRFSTRQQSYGSIQATILVRGAGGTTMETKHQIELSKDAARRKAELYTFHEHRRLNPPRMLPMHDAQNFGIELELTSPPGVSSDLIAQRLQDSGKCGQVIVVGSYSQGRGQQSSWKIVPDGSIMCSTSMPDCNTFELVSPVLQGGKGLDKVAAVSRALNNLNPKIKVNKSMGYHVHIDVSGFSVNQLVKICQNFIKYEEVLDSFMPPSRRSGSPECDRYFKSNVESVNQALGGGHLTNKQRHVALSACADLNSLARLMNQNARYHKLNLQNLVTGRQPTLEFRQHSATVSYAKISAWVRFCTLFVRNSAKLMPPSPCSDDRTVDAKFDYLFMYVIKDRGLRAFYRQRRQDLHVEGNYNDADCTGNGCCAACGKD